MLDRNLKFQTVLTGTWCKASRHQIAEPWEDGQDGGYKEKQSFEEWTNSIVVIQTSNLKGSLQIEFRLCYLNVHLKDILEIWALLQIWFSALQRQATLEFSKTELSFTKMYFFAFQGVFFQDCTMTQNSTENNVQSDCGNLLI